MHTSDVEHDVVGTPHGALHGKQDAQRFYDRLVQDIHTVAQLTSDSAVAATAA